MSHFGHFPGALAVTSGCMGHTYSNCFVFRSRAGRGSCPTSIATASPVSVAGRTRTIVASEARRRRRTRSLLVNLVNLQVRCSQNLLRPESQPTQTANRTRPKKSNCGLVPASFVLAEQSGFWSSLAPPRPSLQCAPLTSWWGALVPDTQ